MRRIAERSAVLYRGQVCEEAPTAALYDQLAHLYTARLLSCLLGRNEPDIPSTATQS